MRAATQTVSRISQPAQAVPLEEREVLVVGGGPAGAATAAFLARAGRDVLLVDRARFPRDKVCGESVSPGAWPVLEALDWGALVQSLAPQALDGMALTSPAGVSFEGRYRGAARAGFALPRARLDAELLQAAGRAGVELRQATRAVELSLREGRVTGAAGWHADGTPWRVAARLVVGADGRAGIVARRLRTLAPHPRLRKFAVRGYWRGVQGLRALGELHVAPGCYCGVAPLGQGAANVTFVIDSRELQPAAGDLEGFYRATLRRWPALAERLEGAALVGLPRACGPLALRARAVWRPGVLLVGDAAGFFDPFTGEGITLALRSAQWAAQAGLAALARHAGTDDLSAYARLRVRHTRDKFRLNRWLYEVVARPWLADWMATRLRRRPALADEVVGLAGDFVPARPGHALELVARLLAA